MFVNIYAVEGPENIRGTILWLALVLFCGAIALNVFLPNNDLNLVASVFVIVFAGLALAFYGWSALKALWIGSFQYTDWLIVGICLTAVATEGREVLVLITRLGGLSPTFLNSEWWVPVKLLYPIGYVCHILPRGAANGDVPKGNIMSVVIAFVVAAALSVALLTVKPSTEGLINNMPPWMKDFWSTGSYAPKPTLPG